MLRRTNFRFNISLRKDVYPRILFCLLRFFGQNFKKTVMLCRLKLGDDARSLGMRLCRKGAFPGQIPCHLDEDKLCQEPCLKICGW